MRPTWLAGVVALLVLAGCSDDASIDEVALEADIAVALVPSDPAAVTSVLCSGAGEADPGDAIDCEVTVGTQALPVTVVFEGDGVVSVTPEQPLLDGQAAAAQLESRFTEELGIATTVECEQSLIVLAPGSTFECVAIDDKGVERILLVGVGSDNQLEVGVK